MWIPLKNDISISARNTNANSSSEEANVLLKKYCHRLSQKQGFSTNYQNPQLCWEWVGNCFLFPVIDDIFVKVLMSAVSVLIFLF